jgi:signal transduction histidine kinase
LTWVLLVALVLGAAVVTLSWLAGRLDRLHIRLATAHASLERQLADRSAATVRVATSELLDPASAVVLVSAAEVARTSAGTAEHERQQSALSEALRAVLGDESVVAELWRNADDADRSALADLAAACERVRLAHRFHDDLVRRTQTMRRRRVVRWFRLAGYAPWPVAYPIDDEPPAALHDGVGTGSTSPSAVAGGGDHPLQQPDR